MNETKRVCLRTHNLTKLYPGTNALVDANVEFCEGEIHALVGANGAGKSTLCKMISGAIEPTRGTIEINGKVFDRLTPKESMENGVGMIYQEFNLVQDLPIYENMFIGKEIRKGPVVQKQQMIQKTQELFDSLGVNIDPTHTIAEISVAYCQLVEIGKTLLEERNILIMDEPTAPLTNQEVELLFKIVRQLKEQGISIIYISHRMEEIMGLSDKITIMRDGQVVKTVNTCDIDVNGILKLMIGRESTMEFPPVIPVDPNAEVVMSVRNLKNDVVNDISFDLKKGEILGLAGLVGAGRTETARAIFGADKLESGSVMVSGKELHIKKPKDAIGKGIAMIPEDRKRQGVHLELPIRQNVSLVVIQSLSKLLTIMKGKENSLIDKYIDALSIKLSSPEDLVNSLSGGNQQKVVLAKWLATEAEVLILDEPTRGIDVGAKKEIYDLMNELKKQGKAIILISSEMHEIIGMSDRVIVLYEGNYVGELNGDQITQENVLRFSSGIATLS